MGSAEVILRVLIDGLTGVHGNLLSSHLNYFRVSGVISLVDGRAGEFCASKQPRPRTPGIDGLNLQCSSYHI